MAKLMWNEPKTLTPRAYVCWGCDVEVAPNEGYYATTPGPGGTRALAGSITLCHHCQMPTFHIKMDNEWYTKPRAREGEGVTGISDKEVESLYDEARVCLSAGAPTAAVMCCRKLIMNVAVKHGATQNESFVFYVDWLDDKRLVPTGAKDVLTHIRKLGGAANHQIEARGRAEAEEVLYFTAILLKNVYEMPARFKAKSAVVAKASPP